MKGEYKKGILKFVEFLKRDVICINSIAPFICPNDPVLICLWGNNIQWLLNVQPGQILFLIQIIGA